jgi:hypothetical protein
MAACWRSSPGCANTVGSDALLRSADSVYRGSPHSAEGKSCCGRVSISDRIGNVHQARDMHICLPDRRQENQEP